MYENIIEEMEGLIEQEVQNLAGDLGQLEQLVMEKVKIIGQGLLQRFPRVLSLSGVEDSFEESSRKIEELVGQKVSDDTIERLVSHAGSVSLRQREKYQSEYFKHHNPPASMVQTNRLYVCADGTTVHEEDGWHEVKVGCLYWQDEQGKPCKRYVGDFGTSEHFGWKLWHDACRCGLLEADEIVMLGDGAVWIRTEHRRHFPRATRSLSTGFMPANISGIAARNFLVKGASTPPNG